jgi:alpha-tubulin suppressor-like RCC1 family protein
MSLLLINEKNILFNNSNNVINIQTLARSTNYNLNVYENDIIISYMYNSIITNNTFDYIRALTNIVQVACGDNHTLFLENTGQVLGCGNGLGLSIGNSYTASGILNPIYCKNSANNANLQNIVQVCCGGATACSLFLENTGQVLGTGSSGYGQLGDGQSTLNTNRYNVAYAIKGNQTNNSGTIMTRIIQISSGIDHSLFLEANGNVLACGYNAYGQLGLNTVNFIANPTPAYVQKIGGTIANNISQVCAIGYNTFLLEDTGQVSGQVLGCGYNNNGQLGIGNTTNQSRLVYMQKGEGYGNINISNIIQIGGGYGCVLLLENTGNVLGCGDNSLGTLGENNNPNPKTTPIYVKQNTIPIANIIQIVGGAGTVEHAAFLNNAWNVYTCGFNYYGQLGYSTNYNTYNANFIPTNIGLNNIIQIAYAGSQTFFLENTGKVLGCGYNNSGQLGVNDRNNRIQPVYCNTTFNTVNVNSTLSLNNKTIFAGFNGNLVYINNTSNATILGYNYNNMYGNLLANNTIISNVNGNGGSLTNVKKVCFGIMHCLILLYDSTCYACGNNFYGQLGIGNNLKKSRPTLLPTINISDINCGENHSIFSINNTNIYGCGLNTSGQLGDNTNINKNSLIQITTNTINVACGANHTVFLTNNYNVFACGNNFYGQLGDNTYINKTSLTQIATNIILIACGKNHTILVDKSNRYNTYIFGNNNNGQLGIAKSNATINALIIQTSPKQIWKIYSNAFLDDTYILYIKPVSQISLVPGLNPQSIQSISSYKGVNTVGRNIGLIELAYNITT